jgi:hypothetical protein
MSRRKTEFVKPDASKPIEPRAKFLKVTDEMQLVTIDKVEKILNEDNPKGIPQFTVRKVTSKKIEHEDHVEFEYIVDEEELLKDSKSTSSWYVLSDFDKATHWPSSGIWYWVWLASDGIRWDEVQQ